MHIIRGIAVAFSTYSKIPMPQFVWKEEDMRYSMCFFPWIGAVIGAILWGWFRLSALLGISTLAFILISAALPLIITGASMWMGLWIPWMHCIRISPESENWKF